MDIDHFRMVSLAKSRAPIILKDGRVGRLVYWPLPEGVKKKSGRGVRHGAKPTVLMGTSTHLSVTVEEIARVWDESKGESISWN